ncbi:MAG: hypothetical protein E6Q97_17920 [Desulfurellales bacterium]|nr:MAG: hypothetical protein E6Q97_17920 [Desulfurellales bacterium]
MSNYPSSMGGPVIADTSAIAPYDRWQTEINYAEQELKKFHERARKVNRRFVDERDAMDTGQKWFNLFHANTKILRAALYSQIPQPEVKRKYLDYKDQVARVAAIVLQRVITPDIDDPRDTFDSAIREVVYDRLVPGMAQVWLRLETDTEEVQLDPLQIPPTPDNGGFMAGAALDEAQATPPKEAEAGQAPATLQTYKRITDQRVVIDYVSWEDFLWSPCRVWEERRWVARRVYMTRQALVKRFGEEVGKKVPLNFRPSGMSSNAPNQSLDPKHQAVEMAAVYEIWDRLDRKVCWYCKDYPELLDEKDDFLNLIGFEPCPKPLLANVTTSNTVPRPDYYLVQDQYRELDTVNNRISMLVQAVKAAGVYDQSATGTQRLLQEGTDNILIPVDNWAAYAEKGGVKGTIDWLPLEAITVALDRLQQNREAIKQQIYELTGIADIVRGASKASETLGAQQIKAQFASTRIKDLQDEIAIFVAQVLRIKAELMVKHFDPELLRKKSNIMRTDDAPLADAALQFLQTEEGFEWRIMVTADQLVQTDYAMQRQERTELLTAVGQYISQIKDIATVAPEMAPLFVTMLKWAVAGFRGAREIEGYLDKQLDEMIKRQQQLQAGPPKPKPEEVKMKMEMERQQAESQRAQAEFQMDMAGKQMELQSDAKKKQMELQYQQQKLQLDLFGQMARGQFQENRHGGAH